MLLVSVPHFGVLLERIGDGGDTGIQLVEAVLLEVDVVSRNARKCASKAVGMVQTSSARR